MNEKAIISRIQILQYEMKCWQEVLAKKSCNNCVHREGGGCKLAYGIAPPPEVYAKGCPSWGYDEIPF